MSLRMKLKRYLHIYTYIDICKPLHISWFSFISLITATLCKFHILPCSGTGRLCMEKCFLTEFNIIPMETH